MSAATGPAPAPELAGPGSFCLEVEDLRRHFGGVWAVDGASFGARSGAITSLIGPNGAGKSTVVGIVGGAIEPSSGRVKFEGQDITHLRTHERARRGLVRTYQLSSEFARLTVLENLLVAAPHQRGESWMTLLLGKRYWRAQEEEFVARAQALLERFRMSEKQDEYAGNLSGGQKRLVEIMRGLMAEPKMLLLDEPMAGVNPTLARTIEEHLVSLAREGLTLLLIEHELDVVERVSDEVVVMSFGKVIGTGTMSELRTRQEVLDAYLGG
ncbi:MAG: ABC transporter ATP-binding protein [Actinomycetota bacterium]|nr:ABC transporter ATP-binding protein [Actinomycetota bacterium]